VVNLIGAQLNNYNIVINLDIKDSVEILGYENELQQVIINLLTNSKDAFVERQIDQRYINIYSYKKDDKLIVEVEDNAGGIDDAILDKIFDSYFTTKGNKGTGIGLNLVKMIIEDSMQGKISVKNTQDGVKFIIELDITDEKVL
jgi:signal transduction histidine kinase